MNEINIEYQTIGVAFMAASAVVLLICSTFDITSAQEEECYAIGCLPFDETECIKALGAIEEFSSMLDGYYQGLDGAAAPDLVQQFINMISQGLIKLQTVHREQC
jgi:hypothetical protein